MKKSSTPTPNSSRQIDITKPSFPDCFRANSYSMLKLVLITGVILMSCLFTQVYFAPSATAHTDSATQLQTVGEDEIFVLRAENNRIVVYRNDEKTPFLTTDTIVSTLPKGDVLRLEKGITVKGKENLHKSLEDYCS